MFDGFYVFYDLSYSFFLVIDRDNNRTLHVRFFSKVSGIDDIMSTNPNLSTMSLRKFIEIFEEFLKHKGVLAIFVVGVFLRLIFFRSQIWLGSDITRDISISLESLKNLSLPMTGSFSSGGPFVFGPGIYWLYMFSYILFPATLLAPWILSLLFGIATMLLLYKLVGSELNKTFFVPLALMVSFAPQLVLSSSVPTQHTFVLTFTALGLMLLRKYWVQKKLVYSFLFGLSLGMALNMHYQAVALIPLPALLLLAPLPFHKKIIAFFLSIIGVTTSLSALIFWDSGQQFANFRNLLDYLLIAQERLYVPNSWRLFLIGYLPNYWFLATGIPSFLALPLLFVGSIYFIFELIKIRRITFGISLLFFFYFLLLITRYYKGERFSGYNLYLLPFILFFSSWSILKIVNTFKKYSDKLQLVALISLAFFVVLSLVNWYKSQILVNPSLGQVSGETIVLRRQFPNQKFRILNYENTNPDASYAMSVYLTSNNLTDKRGIQLGFCSVCSNNTQLIGELFGTKYYLIGENSDPRWQGVSQAEIYDSTIGWLNKRQLKSTFYLDKYLKEKLLN